jgi:hypothetical protein
VYSLEEAGVLKEKECFFSFYLILENIFVFVCGSLGVPARRLGVVQERSETALSKRKNKYV